MLILLRFILLYVNGFYQILQILQSFFEVRSISFLVQWIQFVEGIVELAAMVEMNQVAQLVEDYVADDLGGLAAYGHIECDFPVGSSHSAYVRWQ